MGQFTFVETHRLRPSQNFLKERTLRYILLCLAEGRHDELPPAPIVRYGDERELIAIDGHNLIAVYDLLGKPCRVYVATSASDGLELEAGDSTDGIQARNRDLEEKFEVAKAVANDLAAGGLASFKVLREAYEYLASPQAASRYFGLPVDLEDDSTQDR